MLKDVVSTNLIKKGSAVIDPAENVNVDIIDLSISLCNVWFLSVFLGAKVEHSWISAVKTGTAIVHTQHSILGNKILYDLNVIELAGKMILNISNNDTSAINIKFNRFLN